MKLPWHDEEWQWFFRAQSQHRLPHALLLHGIPGVGKVIFAEGLAQSLLCLQSTPNYNFCSTDDANICSSCRLIQNRCHSNMLWIEPEKAGQAIKVDQIRDMIDFCNQSALQRGYRIVVINTADDLNIHAANALLKTLEEPSRDTLIILISHQLSQIPQTIISRCQRLHFKQPHSNEALSWLKNQLIDESFSAELLLNLAQGAPLIAIQLQNNDLLKARNHLFETLLALQQNNENLISACAKMMSQDLLTMLDFVFTFMLDLYRLQFGNNHLVNSDYQEQLIKLRDKINHQHTAKMLTILQKIRKQIVLGINLNKQLVLENILIQWCSEKTCF